MNVQNLETKNIFFPADQQSSLILLFLSPSILLDQIEAYSNLRKWSFSTSFSTFVIVK